jgi:hypothetical protein
MKRHWITTAVLSLASIAFELNPFLIRKPYYELEGGIWFEPRSSEIHGIAVIAIVKRSEHFGGAWSIQVTGKR